MVSSEFIEGIGLLAGVLGVIAWLPQLHRVWFQDLHEGISMPTILTISFTLVLWLIYGFLVQSIALIFANITAGTCVLAVAFRVFQLRRNEVTSEQK